jgi:hypothetical protein
MRLAPLLLVVMALVGCAASDPGGGPLDGSNSDDPTVTDRYQGNGMVLQRGDDPAELCLGAIAASYPPQCGGIPITNWNWDAVEKEEWASGTTWGSYHVVGTYDGTSFIVEEAGDFVPSADDPTDPFAAPCPEPEGGWAATDATRTSEEDRLAAVKLAEGHPDHTASWIDYINRDPSDPEHPGPYVLVLGFTGDLERHRAEAARLWGGPLCVIQQSRPLSELKSIQRGLEEVTAEIGTGYLGSGIDVMRNQVSLATVIATPELEAALATRFGEGAVQIEPELHPVE